MFYVPLCLLFSYCLRFAPYIAVSILRWCCRSHLFAIKCRMHGTCDKNRALRLRSKQWKLPSLTHVRNELLEPPGAISSVRRTEAAAVDGGWVIPHLMQEEIRQAPFLRLRCVQDEDTSLSAAKSMCLKQAQPCACSPDLPAVSAGSRAKCGRAAARAPPRLPGATGGARHQIGAAMRA